MVTREQIKTTLARLDEVSRIIERMRDKCHVALFEYETGTTRKTLPQADIDALIEDYRVLKAELKRKADELP